MSYATDLILAYYKNVPFFVRSESIDDYGQKSIEHNYPQSSIRYEEAQGKSPDKLTMDVFFYGNGYINKFNLFKKACEDAQPGLLLIPSFGVYEDMRPKLSSANISHDNLGEITTTVTFVKTVEKPSPISSVASAQEAASLSAAVGAGLGGVF